ncbi:halocyanin domain-containing protein [Salinirubellus salinus]|uniref:Halocyanin domain-containing protein n=1 Tax=Salinirubellus salinus TaxID=1364945 RepID=A0A9E7R1J2_9EURY|nr:halocyanin domain-containing protein [Salinirubellus salinus]UWM53803.1 halocyanin domain-containing protein [Salinirubellus salinus]
MNSDADMGRRAFLRTSAGAAAATAAAASAGTAAAQDEVDYGGWFDDVSNFEGTEDFTGQDTVRVEVGAQGNGGAFAFEPPAIRVDPGTTVVFEWTGEGGQHNVLEDGGGYESELIQEAGVHFAVQFEGEGISKYVCQPHETLGMKGAVVVGSGEGDATGSAVEPPAATEAPGGNGGGGGGGEGGDGGTGGEGGEGGGEGGEFAITDLVSGPAGLAMLAMVMALFSPIVFAVVLSLVYRDREE